MTKKTKIVIRIPTEAQSHDNTPYLEHRQFVTYCKANKVDLIENELEALEKNGLLYPCVRMLYPREMLRRRFRQQYRSENPPYKGRLNYKICDKWNPLIELEDLISKSRYWILQECREAIEGGHPFEQALERNNPYILEPEKQKFKIWDKYKVIE